MLGCFLTAIVVLIVIIIFFALVAFPFALLVGLGVALIWGIIWLLFHHIFWGISLLIVIILMELI